MARPRQVQQFARNCIFCFRPAKMTSEHIWGEWLKPYVYRVGNKHILHQRIVGRPGTESISRVQVKAGGSPLLSSIRVVCGDCNHIWLSNIQQKAKPHLLPLIEGKESHLIGLEAQIAIATWATMATITAEFIHRKLSSIAISNEARHVFKEARQPLERWRIYIGHYHRRRWDGAYVHACMPIHFEGHMVVPNIQDRHVPLPTTQWSTFVIGKLYIHVASSITSADLIENWDWRNEPRARSLLVRIWPPKEEIIAWPVRALTDRDAWSFSHAQWRAIHQGTLARYL